MSLYINSNTGVIVCQEDIEKIELADGKRDWKKRKKMSFKVSTLMENYDPERATLIRGCGTYLEFARFQDGSEKLRHANFCRQRLCPMCQWRRSIKLRVQADQIYKLLEERGYKHVFLTLTIKNCDALELPFQTDEIFKAAARLKRSNVYRNAVRGAYRAFEITYNEEQNSYHPHFHLLLTVDGNYFNKENPYYITHDMIMQAWRKAARLDYDPYVHIEGIKVKEGESMTAACVEICKYPTKSAEINTATVLQTIDYTLRGRRLLEWSGVAADVRRELDLDDIETGNLIQTQETEGDVPVEKVVYVWRYGLYIPMDIKKWEEKPQTISADEAIEDLKKGTA